MKTIFVPSKNRAGKLTTLELLDGLNVILVVEPQDEEAYRETYPGIQRIVLPENDMGVAYVRQQMLLNARRMGLDYYWQIDDDIKRFYIKDGKKLVRCSAEEALGGIEKQVDGKKIALASPYYRHLACWEETDYALNKGVWNCLLTNAQTGMDYDQELLVWEDIDFLIKHLKAGWSTLRSSKFNIEVKNSGKENVGGLAEVYEKVENVRVSTEKILARYPEETILNAKDHRGPGIRIKWRLFKDLNTSEYEDW